MHTHSATLGLPSQLNNSNSALLFFSLVVLITPTPWPYHVETVLKRWTVSSQHPLRIWQVHFSFSSQHYWTYHCIFLLICLNPLIRKFYLPFNSIKKIHSFSPTYLVYFFFADFYIIKSKVNQLTKQKPVQRSYSFLLKLSIISASSNTSIILVHHSRNDQ